MGRAWLPRPDLHCPARLLLTLPLPPSPPSLPPGSTRRPARGQRRRGVDEYAAPRKLCGVVGPPGTVRSSRSGCGSGNVDTTAQRPAEWPVLPVSVPLLGNSGFFRAPNGQKRKPDKPERRNRPAGQSRLQRLFSHSKICF